MNKITKQIQNILSQEMDRKQFLKLSGSLILGVIGVSKMLSSLDRLDTKTAKAPSGGYGSSNYGG